MFSCFFSRYHSVVVVFQFEINHLGIFVCQPGSFEIMCSLFYYKTTRLVLDEHSTGEREVTVPPLNLLSVFVLLDPH